MILYKWCEFKNSLSEANAFTPKPLDSSKFVTASQTDLSSSTIPINWDLTPFCLVNLTPGPTSSMWQSKLWQGRISISNLDGKLILLGRYSQLFGDSNQIRQGFRLHFPHHLAPVNLSGSFTCAQMSCNLFVSQTTNHHRQHFALARG
jgi:hypothetical protein